MYQETDELANMSVTDLRLNNDPSQIIISRNNSMYALPTDPNQLGEKKSCEKCNDKSKSYIDSLKYDLCRRIELEVNRGKSKCI